jgi:protein tyrosine/serine phosphatase
MANRSKPVRRWLRQATLGWRQKLGESLPGWARSAFGPAASYLDMLVLDHGIFRLFYVNQHPVGDRAWRSAQPLPHHIRSLARRGLRTVINLRGPLAISSYWLEEAACRQNGVALVNFKMRSRGAPRLSELREMREVIENVEYPVLMHCKSGADRAGLMSVIYRHLKEGVPMAEAKNELSWRYGHIRQADTGILDYFIERYLQDTAARPMPFFEWVETVYDPEELTQSFEAKGWANGLVNSVLRRE